MWRVWRIHGRKLVTSSILGNILHQQSALSLATLFLWERCSPSTWRFLQHASQGYCKRATQEQYEPAQAVQSRARTTRGTICDLPCIFCVSLYPLLPCIPCVEIQYCIRDMNFTNECTCWRCFFRPLVSGSGMSDYAENSTGSILIKIYWSFIFSSFCQWCSSLLVTQGWTTHALSSVKNNITIIRKAKFEIILFRTFSMLGVLYNFPFLQIYYYILALAPCWYLINDTWKA